MPELDYVSLDPPHFQTKHLREDNRAKTVKLLQVHELGEDRHCGCGERCETYSDWVTHFSEILFP